MFKCPEDVRADIARLDKLADIGDIKVAKANKKLKDALNKLEYIEFQLARISEGDLKFATVAFSRKYAVVKVDYLKTKLEEAQEEVRRLTRTKLERLCGVYRDPANFLDGIPYLD
jgi:hypothetical protein